jgi:hypothetical protein
MVVLSKVEDARELLLSTDRAITWSQLQYFGNFVENLCRRVELTDDTSLKPNFKGQKAANPNVGQPLHYNTWDGDQRNVAEFFAEINTYDVVEQVLKPDQRAKSSWSFSIRL